VAKETILQNGAGGGTVPDRCRFRHRADAGPRPSNPERVVAGPVQSTGHSASHCSAVSMLLGPAAFILRPMLATTAAGCGAGGNGSVASDRAGVGRAAAVCTAGGGRRHGGFGAGRLRGTCGPAASVAAGTTGFAAGSDFTGGSGFVGGGGGLTTNFFPSHNGGPLLEELELLFGGGGRLRAAAAARSRSFSRRRSSRRASVRSLPMAVPRSTLQTDPSTNGYIIIYYTAW
jgi:hypothetical protein